MERLDFLFRQAVGAEKGAFILESKEEPLLPCFNTHQHVSRLELKCGTTFRTWRCEFSSLEDGKITLPRCFQALFLFPVPVIACSPWRFF